MQGSKEIHNLLLDLVADLGHIHTLWEIAAVLASLGLAWLAARLVRGRLPAEPKGSWKLGVGGAARVIFPLTALLLILTAKAVLRHWQSVTLLNVAVPLLLSLALVRLAVYMLRKIFAPSGWLNTSERFIAALIWGVLALHLSGLLPDFVKLLDDIAFQVGKQRISVLMVIAAVFSFSVTMLLVLWLSADLEKRVMGATRLDISLRVALAKILRAALAFIGILIALPLAGIDITALSVFGGALGVGIGFGLQKIASNYVSGFIILLDHSVRIGDLVTVDNRYGTVTAITARYVVVKGQDGTEAIIPNETLITSTVLNHSYSNRQVRIGVSVQISYESPLKKAMDIILEAALSHQRVLRDPAPRVYLKNFADSGIELELGAWINDPAEGQLNLRSEINLDIWRRFQEEGIDIPYPQRVVRMIPPP